ncbi:MULTISPECIES: cytidine deaminase [Spiroplasma]|uniref:cytidine deaminase n=1 Tax=Spiroplasma TaxID=2132 RepID=UPI0018DC3228|nr:MULTISPECIES: cytidine deaminase [Spiroplasma]MBH8622876.1 cytidine deaminase [Spiroplasma sp. hyd1]UNF61900.1 cytidine deaminase [Spiroplasma poulsonii]
MANYFEKLKSLSTKAYAPYSNFHVSTICVLKDGTEVNGVNIENAAYSVVLCAERTCLAQVYTLGYRKADIKKLFLYTDSNQKGSPCGMCRQFLWELIDHDVPLEIYNKKGESYVVTIGDLLPYGFTKEDLK